MRLAISGTHCSGKTTLVEAFLLAHSEYIHEPEPYEQMQESFPANRQQRTFFISSSITGSVCKTINRATTSFSNDAPSTLLLTFGVDRTQTRYG
jgi:hypothetical protein